MNDAINLYMFYLLFLLTYFAVHTAIVSVNRFNTLTLLECWLATCEHLAVVSPALAVPKSFPVRKPTFWQEYGRFVNNN